jgi:hypothetical protein
MNEVSVELASLLHQRPDLLHPFIGNTRDALPAIGSEGQRPHGMSFSIRAPTVWVSCNVGA